jgi:hypothetical protein
MNYKFFHNGIKNLIVNPVKVWEIIDLEKAPVSLVKFSLLLPLIILVSLSTFAGSLIFVNTQLSLLYSIFVAIKSFGSLYLSTYISVLIVKEITYSLDLGRDFNVSFMIIVFSVTPFFLCQIMSGLFESLLFVNIMAIYGLYIYWVSVEKVLNPPQHKKMPLLIAAAISITGIFVVTDLILTKLMDKIYFSFFV